MTEPEPTTSSLIYYRLIALWVLAEAMLGGIIHGFRIPVSGLVVGSCAVICICLIAWYAPKKGAILKATIIVAIFKMMLSPQSPPPAYVAVFFQGLMGELLFWNRRLFKLSCIALAVLALLESAVQRILMLTIIYGNDLWTAINDFLNKLDKQKATTNYSLLIGAGYVFLHLVVGVFVGWWSALLPARITKWSEQMAGQQKVGSYHSYNPVPVRSKRRKRLKIGLFVAWLIFMALYAQSYFGLGTPILPPHISLKILLRSVIIVLAWYFIVGPLLKRLLHYWLRKKKKESQTEVQRVLQLLPSTTQLVAESWKASGEPSPRKKGLSRMIEAGKRILVHLFETAGEKPVWIMTGTLQSGKTTALVNWTEDRDDVAGILTPVVEGKRIFLDARTRERFPMEADNGEMDVLRVGRFVFSKNNFEKASDLLRKAKDTKGWLIIDEIGPMELKGEGFAEVLKELLKQQPEGQTMILVVRESIVDKVREYFRLEHATIIRKDQLSIYS